LGFFLYSSFSGQKDICPLLLLSSFASSLPYPNLEFCSVPLPPPASHPLPQPPPPPPHPPQKQTHPTPRYPSYQSPTSQNFFAHSLMHTPVPFEFSYVTLKAPPLLGYSPCPPICPPVFDGPCDFGTFSFQSRVRSPPRSSQSRPLFLGVSLLPPFSSPP